MVFIFQSWANCSGGNPEQRQPFDIAHISPTRFPANYNSVFLNQQWVQAALGVPVNFTVSSNMLVDLFFSATGDPTRRTMADLEYLLQKGRNVALVYGDRDYRCNWMGAENVSLAAVHPGTAAFAAAGYSPITTNASYQGGVVRQQGNLSFSRVFQAGHVVAAYQPETVFRIFQRAMFRRDIATGNVDVGEAGANYSSAGPRSSFGIKHAVPSNPPPVCLVMDAGITCTPDQMEALRNGSAVVEDYVVVWPPPEINTANGTDNAQLPGAPPAGKNRAGRTVTPIAAGSIAFCILVSVVSALLS